jgi:hypothetical protein
MIFGLLKQTNSGLLNGKKQLVEIIPTYLKRLPSLLMEDLLLVVNPFHLFPEINQSRFLV